MVRQAFYSFHFQPDFWRASQVRSIGVVEGNKPATDNEWSNITSNGDIAIKRWINEQMKYRSVTIVLVGAETAHRKWINYEIEQSWSNKMGLLGICIHKLKDQYGLQSNSGFNPFDAFQENGIPLNQIAKLYIPRYDNSKDVYKYISENISDWVEEALRIRQKYE